MNALTAVSILISVIDFNNRLKLILIAIQAPEILH